MGRSLGAACGGVAIKQQTASVVPVQNKCGVKTGARQTCESASGRRANQ